MAKIDFPPSSSSPFTAPNGVIYRYIGIEPNGYWSGTDTDGSTSLNFVEVSGDNMTGDLTLGTDKITLNAAGSGSFTGKITSAPTEDTDSDNTLVTKGYLDLNGGGSDGTGGLGTIGYWTRTDTDLSPVNSGDNLKNVGSAAFEGGITSGSNSQAGYLQCTGNGSTHGYVFASNTNGYTTGLNYKDKAGNGAAFIASDNNGDDLAKIDWFGGATFAGDVKSDASFRVRLPGSPTSIYAQHDTLIQFTNTDDSKSAWRLSGDGSADFAGPVTVKQLLSSSFGNEAFVVSNAEQDQVIRLNNNGSALFSGTLTVNENINGLKRISAAGSGAEPTIRVYSDTLSDYTTDLNADGSATFGGSITIGDVTAWNDPISRSSCFLTSGGSIELYNKNAPSSSNNLLTGYAQGNKTFEVKTDGGATFSGGAIDVSSSGTISVRNYYNASPDNSFPCFAGRNYSGSTTSQIFGDGSATFNGTINASYSSVTADKIGAKIAASSQSINFPAIEARNYNTGYVFTGTDGDSNITSSIKADGIITAKGYSMADLAQL